MQRSTLFSLVLASLFATAAYAAWREKNVTMELTDDEIFVPFPGSQWLINMATKDTAFTTTDGTTYSSAYDAVLYGAPQNNPCRNFNAFINSFVIPASYASWILEKVGLEWGHYLLCYIRNFLAGLVVYYGAAGYLHYHYYIHPRSERIFAVRKRPTWDTIWDQIKISQASLTVYTALPVVTEYAIEHDLTKVYHSFDEIGGFVPYLFYLAVYLVIVEIGIYWMHRTLHTNKFLYKHVHMLHHKYNRAETLTPWASIAFNPLDGILQASPYVLLLPILPVHYITHVLLIFFTALWATYIHDAMDFNIDPIMGPKYHTVHHTHYIYNYGQVFTFCDQYWGTFKNPAGPAGIAPTTRSKLEPTSRMNKKSR